MLEHRLDIGGDLENWMGKLPAELKNVPITRLAIPGTHNSSTYTITKQSSISPDSIKLVKCLGKICKSLVRRCIYRWSVTQLLTIPEQLKGGIRYLDLRVATKPPSEDVFIVHGLYGGNIDGILADILEFIVQHPDEER